MPASIDGFLLNIFLLLGVGLFWVLLPDIWGGVGPGGPEGFIILELTSPLLGSIFKLLLWLLIGFADDNLFCTLFWAFWTF